MRHTRIAVIALTVAAIADGIVTTCALPPEWDGVRWLVPFIAIYGVVFWWLHHDSALHDYQPSALLKVGIVLVIMIFMPVYLFKSRQAGGRLRDKVEGWRDAIIALRAEAEAWLDFAEAEDDVEAGLASAARAGEAIARLRADVAAALADAGRGMRLRDGLVIAVVGEPNVGKSSLINVLSGRDAAIVSEHAGTTRDLIELPLAVAGVGVTLIDTAGLRETSDPVEAEGIRRARARAAQADLVLHVAEALPDAPLGQVVINKIDRSGMAAGMRDGVIHVSASTGAGIAAFEAWLDDWVRAAVRPGEAALVSQLRHRQALAAALDDIDAALATDDLVLRAESLRLASRALGRITGAVGVEDVLDAIFGRFCIGK